MSSPEERPPTIETTVSSFWRPWDATQGPGEPVGVDPFPSLSEIAKVLPSEYAVFQIGSLLVVRTTIHEGIIDTPNTQTFDVLHPRMFVVEARTELIDLAGVESRTPQLVPHMLESGITTALDLGDGNVLANNPNIVQLV